MLWALTMSMEQAFGCLNLGPDEKAVHQMQVPLEDGFMGVRFAIHVGGFNDILGLATLSLVVPIRGQANEWTWVLEDMLRFNGDAIPCVDRREVQHAGFWPLPKHVSEIVARRLPPQQIPYIRRNDNSPEALRMRLDGATFPHQLGRWWRTP